MQVDVRIAALQRPCGGVGREQITELAAACCASAADGLQAVERAHYYISIAVAVAANART